MTFTLKVLSQQDNHWKDENLGFDNASTIGTDGCALTCLTMLVNGYGFSETPSSMNKKLKDMGSGNGFLGGLIVWDGLTRAFPGIIFRRIIICRDQPAPLDAIGASLDAGQPVVVEVDRSPAPGLQNHWVVLVSRSGSDYLMLDPWPNPPDPTPVSLSGRFAAGRPPSTVITAVVWYEAAGSTPSPVPSGDGLTVRVLASATAGLRMRSGPNTAALVTATEPPGAILRCLETEAVVLAKIGITGQWLKVSDSGGQTGYVAAWYVEKMGDTPPAPEPEPEPEPEPGPTPEPAALTVAIGSSVTAGLRMRAQPNTTSATVVILPAGTVLTVLETEAQALPKIGHANQWLNVKEPGGKTGYVYAQYVVIKSTPEPITTPLPAPTMLTVFVSGQASAGLNLRDGPKTTAKTIKVLPAGTLMTVLEPEATVLGKIGVFNQWLNVKEPGGATGYVAAWYVEKK